MHRDMLMSESYGAAQIAISKHNALRSTGSARSIVYDGQFIEIIGRKAEVIFSESVRIRCLKSFLAPVKSLAYGLIRRIKNGEIIHIDSHFQKRHLTLVQFVPYFLVRKQDNALGMIHKAGNAVRMEIAQNGHSNRTICIGRQKTYRPTGRIFGTYCNFVSRFDPGILKGKGELGDMLGKLSVGNSFSSVVAQCRLVPQRLHIGLKGR